MNFEKRKIFLTLDGLEYSFYYACNQKTTFYDLLEFLIFLIPSLNLCQCYQFQANKDKKKSDEQCFTISETSKIAQYADYLNVLRLKKSKHICNHSYKKYLIHSKKSIIHYYQKYMDSLEESKDKEINSLNDEINSQKNEINRQKNEINSLKDEINRQKNEISNLKNERDRQKNEIISQKNEINRQKNEINSLKDEINRQKNEISNLKNERDRQKNEIISQKNEINRQKNEINSQKNEINRLKIERNSLRNDIYKQKNEVNCQKYEINNQKKEINSQKSEINSLRNKITELGNKIIFDQTKDEIPENFYDAIIHIDSIKDINKGWKIEMSEKGKQNYLKYKNEKIIKIGVIGNANKGKSFILSKISKMELPSGYCIKTEGLSIKYPDLETHKNRKIALLDSAGLETPVLVEKQENEKDDNDKRKEKNDEEKNDLFKEKCREKLITELFLQNYIIHNSDVLIVIVDCLSFSEQKLIMKVKKEIERAKRNKPLYIIHNLKTYTTVAQVEHYIENTLLKSATFSLKNDGKIDTENNITDAKFKFYEIQKDERSPDIFHLIYANEDSDAGKLYNPLTLNFIENIYQNITNIKNYDFIDTIKDRFISIYKEIIEKKENDQNITKESFDNSAPNLIRLKDDKEIILKKCLIDEVGFSNLKPNGFEPKYNIFNKDNKIIIRVEIPGNCKIDSEIKVEGEYFIIRLKGEKIEDKEPDKIEDNIYNFREFGKFDLDILLNSKDYNLFSLCKEIPKFTRMEGIYIIEYKLEEKKGPFGPGEVICSL